MAERRSLRKILAWFAVGLIAAVALAEGTARIAEASGPPVLRWYDASTQLKVEQMDALGDADVVFAGTSMVWQGLVPDRFTAADPQGRSAWNAGLAGGVPVVMEPWLLDEVAPRLQPDVVVWGLSSMDYSSSYGEDNLERYRDALESRTGWLAGVEQATSEVSALVRYRTLLRRPGAMFGTERDDIEQDFADAAAILGPGGERRDFEVDFGDRRAAQVESRFRGYRIDAADLEALHRTVTALQDRGIEVVFVEMPTPDRYEALHPEGAEDLARAHEATVAMGEVLGVEVIDLRRGFTDDDFVDFTHLNEAAAAALTARLASALDGGTDDPGTGTTTTTTTTVPADPSADLATANRAVAVYSDLYHWMLGGGNGLRVPTFWYGLAHYGRTIDVVDTATNGPDVEVLFVGSSVMQDAADPTLFTETDGRASFNAALPRLYPEMVNLWMREQVMSRLEPDVVVLGVGIGALRAWEDQEGTCSAPVDDWVVSREEREAAFAPIPSLAGYDWEALALGDPISVEVDPIYREEFDADGNRLEYDIATEQEMEDSDKTRWARRYEPCQDRIDGVTDTIGWLIGRGSRVVVVGMPVRDRLAVLFPDGGREVVDGLFAPLEAAALAAGAEAYLDYTNLVPDDQFRDWLHVDPRGSRLFTTTLTDDLAGL